MANYNNLKAGIDAVIKTNGRQKISGAALNAQLKNMITELGAGYQYMGVASPATNPGTPDANVFYLASEAGTYTNFGGIVINEGEVCALVWNGTWTKEVTGIASADKLNQLGQEIDGNVEIYTHTFEQEQGYYDYGEFPEPIPVGSYINRIVTGHGESVVWLCGQGGTSVKQLTGEELPFVTDQIYYGIRNSINDTVRLYISVGGAPQEGITVRVNDLEDRADSLESDVADLSDEVRGNSETFTHTFVNQPDSFMEFAPFPNNLPVGTHINELITSPVGDVWLCVGHSATTKLTGQTLPYITDRVYDGIVYQQLNGAVSINYSASERIVGVEKRIDVLEDKTDTLEEKVDSLDLYVRGNSEDFIHTFDQQSSWDEYAPFPSKIPAGTYITELHTKFNSVVWLCGQDTYSAKNLTDQILPFVTDADYYGIRINNLKDTIELTHCDSSVIIEGLKDRVRKLEQEVNPNARECVHIYRTDTQSQLFQKMRYAFIQGNCDVFFEKSTYILDDVYDEIRQALGTWAVGLPIGNNCRYFMNGSTIISNPPSSDHFSDSRNVLDCQVSSQSYEVWDAILINNGGRYCIHDEGNAGATPYIHRYENVQMFYHHTEYTPDDGAKPFGCGTGFDSTLLFNGCLFKTDLVGGVCFAVHGINQENPDPCIFRLTMTNSCIYTGTMYMNLLDATRDTIEYYLANNKWGTDFDATNSTFAVKFNNVI